MVRRENELDEKLDVGEHRRNYDTCRDDQRTVRLAERARHAEQLRLDREAPDRKDREEYEGHEGTLHYVSPESERDHRERELLVYTFLRGRNACVRA